MSSNSQNENNTESDSESDNGSSVDRVVIKTFPNNEESHNIVMQHAENLNKNETKSNEIADSSNDAQSSSNHSIPRRNSREQFNQQQRIMEIRYANREINFGIFRQSIGRTLAITETGKSKDSKLPKTKNLDLNFDRNLPTSHSYLGELEECHGVAYQEDNILLQLSILLVDDFILIPGQTLPLQIFHPNEVSMIRQVMNDENKLFGIVSYNRESVLQPRVMSEIGCTAEIRSIKDKEQYGITVMAIVVQGRQRFKIVNKRAQVNGNIIATVNILSDFDLPSLNKNIIKNHYCLGKYTSSVSPNYSKFPTYDRFKQKYKLTKQGAHSTHWNAWIYRMYDLDYLRMLIFWELREWNPDLQESQVPVDHSEFSFWVIRTLPISQAWRVYLVGLDSAVQRMRWQLYLLSQRTVIACKSCSSHIANRSDSFSMSASGPMAAYVNPGGVVHETLTVLKVEGVDHIGDKTTENSWFPGYAWTILQCSHCYHHLGWKFTSTKSKLRPKKFWGLSRSCMRPINPEDPDHDVIQPHL